MPPKVIDLVGQRFGKLTVVAQDKTFQGKGSRWICDCDCGTMGVLVRRSMLIGGKTKSCGCYKQEYLESIFNDLSGQRFGKLTVRERYDKKGRTYWSCDCDCGTKGVIASSNDLKSGDKTSCGCVRELYIREHDLTGQKFGRLIVKEKSQRRSANGDIYYVCDCDCGKKGIEVVRSSLVAKDSHKQVSCGCWVKEGHNSVNRNSDRKSAITKTLYTKLKVRNRKLGFGDEIITITDFANLIERPCAYCGITESDSSKEPYSYRAKQKEIVSYHINLDYVYRHNGIDRIDSNKGYTLDNVLPCCKYCNAAKLDHSQTDFLEWVERVYSHFVVGESTAQ